MTENSENYNFKLLDCEANDWWHVHDVKVDSFENYEYRQIISSNDLTLCCLIRAAPELLEVCENLLKNSSSLTEEEKQNLEKVVQKAKGENLKFIKGEAVFA